jgi:hypothetical protein
MSKVTKKALNGQLRAVFGRGVEGAICNDRIFVRFDRRRGETTDEMRTRVLGRLDHLPAEDT